MQNSSYKIEIDRFDDIRLLNFRVPNFESLPLNKKQLIYHLYQAAIWGRDIFTDQNFEYNLTIRNSLESIYQSPNIDKNSSEFKMLDLYLKKVWFASGVHHHYSNEKFIPQFSREYFINIAKECGVDSSDIEICIDVLFTDKYKSRCSQDMSSDLLLASCSNYYKGVDQKSAQEFYNSLYERGDKKEPLSYGLNSRLVNSDGSLQEEVYKIGGRYGCYIEKIVENLVNALPFCENGEQRDVIEALIEYYKSGDLKDFDNYNIKWLKDLNSDIDFVNGFIEVYGDPLGYKASWEANVNIKDIEATKRSDILSSWAQWFEDNSPIDSQFKKSEVVGVSSKVISVVAIGGDCYGATPLGINLPNSDWIRKEHGSKSVTIKNISDAYSEASQGDGFLDEFILEPAERELHKKYGSLAGNLHTELHECLGHGSGQLAPSVVGDELRNYSSPIEEARADLFALYYMGDEKLIELGLMPDMDVMRVEYNHYIFNGLIGQLVRIELGKDIMQAHMRNRQLIARWCYEKGAKQNIISIIKVEGKSYVKISDYTALRALFGELLCEIQRVKSEGDYSTAKHLIEEYGVKIDYDLHSEILDRYRELNLAPYIGFINPELTLERDSSANITDVKLSHCDSFSKQMLEYSSNYSIKESF